MLDKQLNFHHRLPLLMSGDDDIEHEGDTLVQESEPELKQPSMYQVIMLNDDYTCLLYTSDAADDP